MGRDKVKLVRALGVPELPAEGSDTKQRFAALRGSSLVAGVRGIY